MPKAFKHLPVERSFEARDLFAIEICSVISRRVFLSNRTEADFQEWRDQRDRTARKYALWEAGERLPSQHSMMRCACGETFDSHRLEESLIHVPHLSAAHEIRRTERLH